MYHLAILWLAIAAASYLIGRWHGKRTGSVIGAES